MLLRLHQQSLTHSLTHSLHDCPTGEKKVLRNIQGKIWIFRAARSMWCALTGCRSKLTCIPSFPPVVSSTIQHTLPVRSLDTPYQLNMFSFILMTIGSKVSHWRHQNYELTHMEFCRKGNRNKQFFKIKFTFIKVYLEWFLLFSLLHNHI